MNTTKEYLLVDGYNIIHAWDELKEIAASSLQNSRTRLLEIMSNYQGIKQIEIFVVFDAHMQKGNIGSYEKYFNINVIYTKESQTADRYIERFAKKNANKYRIRVATSDNLEQVIILGRGAQRLSATDLLVEVESVKKEIKEKYLDIKPVKNNMLLNNLDPKTAKILEQMRYNNKN